MAEEVKKLREHWSSKFGFLFAAIGSAVGLGVLWKFPYIVGQNGGGLFLLCYVVCVLIVGLPVLIGELVMGRKAQAAAVGAFSKLNKGNSFWVLGGWLGVFT